MSARQPLYDMTYSMTAYAQASVKTEAGELSCELRGVNHRYLDIAPRMPEELRVFETELRDLVAQKVARGHLDCFIRLSDVDSSATEVNIELAGKLQQIIEQAQRHLPTLQPLRAIDLLQWPGLLNTKKLPPETLKQHLASVVEASLDSLLQARAIEGEKMAQLIRQRVQAMHDIVDGVSAYLPEIAADYRQRLEEKLAEIKENLDPSRLEQEVVMFLQKSDVAEELDRLRVHLGEVNQVLDQNQPVGRRLDFLMQELNREANTLGSKSRDPRITQAAVDMKVLIEQMREQVQNIE